MGDRAQHRALAACAGNQPGCGGRSGDQKRDRRKTGLKAGLQTCEVGGDTRRPAQLQRAVAEPDQACAEGEGNAAKPVDTGSHTFGQTADGGSDQHCAGWQQGQQHRFGQGAGPDQRDQGGGAQRQGWQMQAARLGVAEKGFARTQQPPQCDRPGRKHKPRQCLGGVARFTGRGQAELCRHGAPVKMGEGGTVGFDQGCRAAGPDHEQEQRQRHRAGLHCQQARGAPCGIPGRQQQQRHAQCQGGGQPARQCRQRQCGTDGAGHRDGTTRVVGARRCGCQCPQQQRAGRNQRRLSRNFMGARQQARAGQQRQHGEPALGITEGSARGPVHRIHRHHGPDPAGEARGIVWVQPAAAGCAAKQFDE